MIVDVRLPYRIDFVPKRSRNVRRGFAVETASFFIRETTSETAPAVLRVGPRGSGRTIRAIEGLLYEPVSHDHLPRHGEPREPSLERAVQARIHKLARAACVVPEEVRMRSRMPEDATVVLSHREHAVSLLSRLLEEELVVIDGGLHGRARSPMHDVSEFSWIPGAEFLEDVVPGTRIASWFAPPIDGVPLRDLLASLLASSTSATSAEADRTLSMLETRILDRDLFDAAACDPRNLDTAGIEADARLRLNRLADDMHRHHPSGSVRLPFLLHAMARREAEAGTSPAGIAERMDAVVSPPPDADGVELARHECRLLELRLRRHEPPTLEVVGAGGSFDHAGGESPLVFRCADIGSAVAVVRDAWRRDWTTRLRIEAEAADDADFDFDGWNLRVAVSHILASMDGRVAHLPKNDVDAIVRTTVFLRDWRIRPSLVADPDRRDLFHADVDALLSSGDGPRTWSTCSDWAIEMSRNCLASILADEPADGLTEGDPELRGFAF